MRPKPKTPLTIKRNGRDIWDVQAVVAEARRLYGHTPGVSAYGGIVKLVGEANADRIMRAIEIAAWQPGEF